LSTPQPEPKIEVKQPTVVSDADLLQKIAMLEARLDVREKQLKQAIDLSQRALDEKKAAEEKERAKLIDSIQQDSKFTKEDLKDKSLTDLTTMRITLDRSIEKTFASVAADIEAQKHSHKPFLTVGKWDPATRTYVGGM
jgi:hypothetical protein